MKFRIRYADQLVGILVIVALVSLIFVIVMLGKAQSWFSRTYTFTTYAATAAGLNQNMHVNCKAMPIGNVKSFKLTNDNRIKIEFTIQSQYIDRAKEGSLVEISVSPIGFGSQFIFHPGLGKPLSEGALIPLRNSPEANYYIAQGLTNLPPSDDFIAVLVEQATGILAELDSTIKDLNTPPNARAVTALGQAIVDVQRITSSLAEDMSNPNKGVRTILNGNGDAIKALETTLIHLAGTLNNVEKTTAHLPGEMPQIRTLLAEARSAVKAADDVLVGLSNNPLLRKGIPDRVEVDSSGTSPRNIKF